MRVCSMIQSGDELTEEHESVRQVKLAHQQPLLGTLDECFQLYTQEERVCVSDGFLWGVPPCTHIGLCLALISWIILGCSHRKLKLYKLLFMP